MKRALLFALLLASSASPLLAQGEGDPPAAPPREEKPAAEPPPKEGGGAVERRRALEARIRWIDLRAPRVDEAVRLLCQASGANVVCTLEAAQIQLPALLLQDVSVRSAVETLCKVAGLWYRESEGIVRIMTAAEYRDDLVVQREPELRVFTLLHPNAAVVAGAINDLYPGRVQLSYGLQTEALARPLAASGLGTSSAGFGSSGFGNNGFGNAGFGNAGFGNAGFGNGGNFGGNNFGGNTFGGGRLSNSVGGFGGQNGFNSFGRGFGGQLEGNQALRENLSAEQLSRVRLDQNNRVVGDASGLVDGRPIIAVTVNRRQNLMVVRTADEQAMGQIERLVLELDRPTPQVLLEVKVLELDLGDDFRSSLDIDLVAGPDRTNLPTGEATNPLVQSAATVAEQILGAGNAPYQGGALVYQFLNDHVRVRLEALETEGRMSALATPLLLCANNEVSRLFIGEERTLVRDFNVTSNVTTGVTQSLFEPVVEVRDIGNTLRLVPSINADRTVTLTIVQETSSVNVGGATLPVPNSQGGVQSFAVDTVNTAYLEGTVVAKDGLTLAVGGLIRKEMVDRTSGIPYLMDIPLIGWLFGETTRAEVHRELVLIITPHVLTTPAEGEEVSRRRMEALSLHPFHDVGDRALQRYQRHDVPGAEDYGRLVEDYLLPWNEPIRGGK